MRNFNELFNEIANTNKNDVNLEKIAEDIMSEDGDIQLMNIAAGLRRIVEVTGNNVCQTRDCYEIKLEEIATTFEKVATGWTRIRNTKKSGGFNYFL